MSNYVVVREQNREVLHVPHPHIAIAIANQTGYSLLWKAKEVKYAADDVTSHIYIEN